MSASKYKLKNPMRLADMRPTMTSFCTVALIIAKSEPYVFCDKLSSEKRGVINFTLRDTRRHIANCKCWGSEESVQEYNAILQLGDVIDVVGAKVMAITLNNSLNEQLYQPRGTLSCALVVNEGHGYLVKHSSEDLVTLQTLRQLAQQSHTAHSAALKLSDVRLMAPGNELRSSAFVDLLVVVAAMRPVRQLKRKQAARNGTTLLHCLELVVIDASFPAGMLFTTWHPDWIRRAQRWQPGKTLLHLIDVRVAYSQFHGCAVLSHASCTLIYENPQPLGGDVQALLGFIGQRAVYNFDLLLQDDLENLPKPSEIQTQMTVRQIYTRAEGDMQDATSGQFTAILYAMASKFDIDGLGTYINKNKSCHRLIPNNRDECGNEHCQLEFEYNNERIEKFFNINMQLSDQTGTLIEAHLSGDIATHLLGVNPEAFELLSERKKSELKWRFLLKYFKVKLVVKKATAMRKNLAIFVVDMQLIEMEELIKKMAAF
ncbi:hypothetical protein KR093_007831 [Drosophila rubida]|uniref:MEIOB-like N-terminal domain-containing protein n=1 Tax=Drosophila rubida TaxID=30044 RepID=A0AAD4KCR4_9MUSC|nr:hypothetical protein KR093_007831 [Drosophila rubida]